MNGSTPVTLIWVANFAVTAWFLRGGAGAYGARWCRFQFLTATIGLVFTLAFRNWAAAGFCTLTLILLFGDWWRRRGRKVARQLGAESLAVLAAIVKRAREAGSAPVPQGAKA